MSAGPTARPAPAPVAPGAPGPPGRARPGPGRLGAGRRLLVVVGAALAVAGAVMAGGYGALALAAAGGHEEAGGLAAAGPGDPGTAAAPAPVLGPGPVTVELAVEHSLFVAAPGPLRVVAGTDVRFVVDNRDPIVHELIVGPPAVHAHHESGDHALHGTVPGEVTVAPRAEGVTTFTFDEPGTVEYACHFPGHYAYGMHGTIEVVPA